MRRWMWAGALLACGWVSASFAGDLSEDFVAEVATAHKLSPEQAAALRRALGAARGATQGVAASNHPMSRAACLAGAAGTAVLNPPPGDEVVCGRPGMAPLRDPDGVVRSCVDRFEWPNMACAYPVTWVNAAEAAGICAAEGKRLCDAREWEGACAGTMEGPEWEKTGGNASRNVVYAYGGARQGDACAFGIPKSPGCDAAIQKNIGVREACGTNTYPSGAFPACKSAIGVYDQHGNAAEHMNLPRRPGESTRNGGLGVTEMKGSWFVFPKTTKAAVHPDDCRWREPGWHRTGTGDPKGHGNYHLGFRCCATAP